MDIRGIDTQTDYTADTLIAFVYENNPQIAMPPGYSAVEGAINSIRDKGDLKGIPGETCVLYAPERVIVVGLGPIEDITLDTARRGAAHALTRAGELNCRTAAAALPGATADFPADLMAQAVAEGFWLSAYRFTQFLSEPGTFQPPENILLIIDKNELSTAEAGITAAKAISAGVVVARDLVNMPPNYCTSLYLADVALQLGNDVGLSVNVLDEHAIAELNMGAFLGVARGSDTPPRFIIMEHNADRAEELDTIVLVGKGITFDTGGYNLKPAEGQGTMKTDMAGAAAVIGAMRAIGELNPPVHVVGLAPAVDNMISGRAYRQQEVITASNGVTIEIGNTDAEGRMLLADALVYAARYNPAAVIDIATLTGSSVIALGRQAASLFSTDDTLRDRLLAASDMTNERIWPMPLYPEYITAIKSYVADVSNTAGRFGGVGAAAMFLKQFVSYPSWAHIDIAGMALVSEKRLTEPYMQLNSATGFGVRLFAEFVRKWS